MAAKYAISMNCSRNFIGIWKENDCQTVNTKGIINVKEQIWLTIVKYFRLSTCHFMVISIIYIHIYNFKRFWHKLGKRNTCAKQGNP